MAAGIADQLWSLEDIVAKMDAMALTPKPGGLAGSAGPKIKLRHYPEI